MLGVNSFDRRNQGIGFEIGRTLMTNLQATAGYNLFGFTDPDFTTSTPTQQGVYFRLRFKFDEQLLDGILPGQVERR